ncbi:hypothetical protein QAD02_024188, partial [Eretmocerus hayati]
MYILQHKNRSLAIIQGQYSIGTVRVNVLDKNDVAPQWAFGPWKFEISEEAPPNTLVAQLKAQDPDTIGSPKYSIVGPPKGSSQSTPNDEDNLIDGNRLSNPFKLDAVTGQLRLAEALDREVKPSYTLRVRADDGLQHSDVTLTIIVSDTNDNAPQFESMAYSFDVAENVARGSKVGQVIASDSDAEGPNSQLTYSLISDWANDVQHYILVVQATDSGSPPLSSTVTVYCNVLDLNDNAPSFEPGPRSAELLENATVGSVVLSARAIDLDSIDNGNGLVTYSIIDGANDDFGIADNGTIYTRRPLDRETKPLYSLVIEATDSPRPPVKPLVSTIQVTISLLDVNDEAPEFVSSNKSTVSEAAAPNSIVMVVKAVDRDEGRNGHVEYSLEQENLQQPQPFILGQVDGVLRVAGSLDREIRSNYSLRVTARDRGEPPKSNSQLILVSLLDENDNSPSFDPRQYSASVAENASIGASVIQVSATDRDDGPNGRVRYSIASGDENRDFSISEDGGVIRVAKNLNYERKARYRLQIRAEDCARQLAPVTGLVDDSDERYTSRYDLAEVLVNVLDVNDNPPAFLDSPYLAHLMENMLPPNRGFVMQVKAHDADTPLYSEQIRYFLKEGDTDLFRVNASTGEIFLLRPLDRELVPEYSLTIVAMDSGSPPLTGSGIVRIVVLDVNDHSPEFGRQEYKASVMENLPAGAWVANPSANDKDEGLNAKIRYSILGEKADKFSVNASTGEIVTTEKLDREQAAVYHLTLVAQDSSPTEPRASAVNLTIFVGDVNDNSPKFSSPKYTAYIPDSTSRGDFVFGAKAIDDDDGLNARLEYRLLGGDARLFTIDTRSGVIRSNEKLTRGNQQQRGSYQLEIEAKDSGAEARKTRAELVVHLWERQLFPSFKPATTTNFVVSEDVPEGRLITTLAASTPKGPASELLFGIAGGNLGDALRIEPRTGEVLVASGFDYETAPRLEAWVEVRDSGNPPLRSVVQLLVNVTDANDNAPVIEPAVQNASVLEEEYPPLLVAKISARDVDSGPNGEVTYHLLDDFEQTFVIDETTGEISTNAKLDREE